ncbi:MAG: hypothetical protein NUW22_05190 [Acidobacteria bacterium]|nr:hypothetical protein [Acidobacteriota bacterium]
MRRDLNTIKGLDRITAAVARVNSTELVDFVTARLAHAIAASVGETCRADGLPVLMDAGSAHRLAEVDAFANGFGVDFQLDPTWPAAAYAGIVSTLVSKIAFDAITTTTRAHARLAAPFFASGTEYGITIHLSCEADLLCAALYWPPREPKGATR